MRSDEALAIAAKSIPKALESAGFLNGEALDEDEIGKRNAPIFWPIKAEDPDATGKKIFAVWKIQTIDPQSSADDAVTARDATAYLDFWVMGSPYAKQFEKYVANASKALEKEGWEVELNGQPYFDSSSKRTQVSYVLTKSI